MVEIIFLIPITCHRYIIATQDASLRDVARSIPGTPVMYLHFRSPTLEKPSEESTGLAGANLQTRYNKSPYIIW